MFADQVQIQFERDALAQIRKDASNPYARIHSIAEDGKFVNSIRSHYSTCTIIANLRCGAWYMDCSGPDAIFSHFKSADGHYNGWSFNLRRPNLHIIPHIIKTHGALIVDSTRSGKSMPDSFSKTLPIWCCVVNRAVKLRFSCIADKSDWDESLHCPPQCVSTQEKYEIEKKLPIWAKELASSTFDLPLLPWPLRPIWLTPSSSILPDFRDDTPFLPLICLTASRQVNNGLERRANGFSYVQGAGDDHENWSKGLTPEAFWMNQEELLSSTEKDLPNVLIRIVSESATRRECLPTIHPTSISRVNGLVRVAKAQTRWSEITGYLGASSSDWAIIVLNEVTLTRTDASVEKVGWILDTDSESSRTLLFNVISDRKGGDNSLKGSLRKCMDFIGFHLRNNRDVCIACNKGTDLSVGVAAAALQMFFDDSGALDLIRQPTIKASKDSLRLRLHWIIESKPDANPSRTTLKRINEFFMSHRNT